MFRNLKNDKNFLGILMMIIQAFAMSVLYLVIKELTKTLHPFQISFLYKFAIFIFILPWCLTNKYSKDNNKSVFKTKKFPLHVAHGVFSMLGTLCFVIAMGEINPLDAAAISLFDHVLLIFIGVIFFKEKLLHSKIVAIVLSTAGAIFIIKPGFKDFNLSYVYIFMAAGFWSVNNSVIKMLTKTERSKVQLFYSMGFASLFSFPMALSEWQSLEVEHIQYLLALAFCYLVHKVTFYKSYKFSEITVVMPFDYTRLIFTGLLSYFILDKIPDMYSVLGYALITIGGLYLIAHEAKKKTK